MVSAVGRPDLNEALGPYGGDPRWVRRQIDRARVRRQRRIATATIGALLVVVVAAGAWTHIGAGHHHVAAATKPSGPPAPTSPQLPGGGRVILPRDRVVAFYGAPQDPGLGILGIGSPASEGTRLLAMARRYAFAGRPVLPAMELIATIVQAAPGTDGRYRVRQTADVIDQYLAAARRVHALLILDIQPGRSPFMDEVRAYRHWLRLPDVGLALDPEWSMRPGQVPGRVIGSTDAAVVNEVGAYLAGIVKRHDLPQKILIVHRFTTGMITDPRRLRTHPGVALTINVDGFGDRPNKISKYAIVAHHRPGRFNGFKRFFHEDTHLMGPRVVMRLRPQPDVVVYE